MIRSHVEVLFTRNSADLNTGESWVNGQKAKLPDVQALRHVDAGNAEYATKTQAKKVGEDPEDTEKVATAKKK